MINLIPNQEKKRMTKDFYLRILIVFFITIGMSFILASLSILPYYLFSVSRKEEINQKLENQKNIPIPQFNDETTILLKDLDYKLQIMQNVQKDKFLVSEKIINAILQEKMPDIKITQITYNNEKITGKKIEIKGNAPSRDRLLLFRLSLENNSNFEKVDLPISNFIKGKDIKFNLTLIPLTKHEK